MTSGSRDRTFGAADRRAKTRSAPRSLGAALREAGLGEAAPEPRLGLDPETSPRRSYGARLSSAIAATRSPGLAMFAEAEAPADHPPAPVIMPAAPATQGVVSPPPWLRAARRSRWRARLASAFGWAVTLIIAGSIIGLAGHHLGISSALMQASLQARR